MQIASAHKSWARTSHMASPNYKEPRRTVLPGDQRERIGNIWGIALRVTAALPYKRNPELDLQAHLSSGLMTNRWSIFHTLGSLHCPQGLRALLSISRAYQHSEVQKEGWTQGIGLCLSPQIVLWLLLRGVHCPTLVGRMSSTFPASAEDLQCSSWTVSKSCCPVVHRAPTCCGWMMLTWVDRGGFLNSDSGLSRQLLPLAYCLLAWLQPSNLDLFLEAMCVPVVSG